MRSWMASSTDFKVTKNRRRKRSLQAKVKYKTSLKFASFAATVKRKADPIAPNHSATAANFSYNWNIQLPSCIYSLLPTYGAVYSKLLLGLAQSWLYPLESVCLQALLKTLASMKLKRSHNFWKHEFYFSVVSRTPNILCRQISFLYWLKAYQTLTSIDWSAFGAKPTIPEGEP